MSKIQFGFEVATEYRRGLKELLYHDGDLLWGDRIIVGFVNIQLWSEKLHTMNDDCGKR